MYLPSEWRGLAKLIFVLSGCHEPELLLLKDWLRPGMTVVDAGASYGVYTVMAAQCVAPDGVVIAFEPALETYEILLKNIRINNLENVMALRRALGSRTERTLLWHHADPSRSSLAPNSDCRRAEAIDVVLLDDALEQLRIRSLDVIKVDVEGAEGLVLEGAQKSIQRFRPLMLVEIHSHAARRMGWEPADLFRMFSKLGYVVFQMFPPAGNLEFVRSEAQLEHCQIVIAAHGQVAAQLVERSKRHL